MPCKTAARHLRKILLNLDLFGQAPSFRILGNQKFNTASGTLLTFLVVFLTISYLIVGVYEIIAENSPNVVQSDGQVIETTPFPLVRKNFTFAITLADVNQMPLTNINKYVKITLKNCKATRIINETTNTVNASRNCTEIPLETCSKEHFITQAQINYFSLIKLDSFQCIQKDYWDNHPPILQGIATSKLFQSLTVQVSFCQNTTNKSDCAPIEDIKQKLSYGFYGVHLSDSLLQMDRPGVVALDIINMQYNTFSVVNSRVIGQEFKLINTLTDIGIALTDYKQQQTLIQDTIRESAEQYNNQYLIQHNIYLSSKFSKYTRSYLKIQVILSRVGGLYQMIFLVVTFLIKGIVQLQLDIDMANEIYRFGDSKSNERQIKKLTFKRINVVKGLTGAIKSRRKLQSSSDSDRLDESDLNQSNNIFLVNQLSNQNYNLDDYIKQKDQIDNGFKKTLLIFLGCDKKTQQALEIAKEKYMDQLDIKNIIKKLYEFDQLKKIILSDDQYKLFSLLPKPHIIEKQENSLNKKLSNNHSEQLQDGYDAFTKVVAQDNKSFVDLKIIQQLDPDIQNIYSSVQRASNTNNQLLFDFPFKSSERRLTNGNAIINSVQDIEFERDFPIKVYVQTPKFKK